ncbi:acid sphingomyelinase-like phosphodiesterase 3a [Harmonia axyridis]|uniref:acid sphingomyelinase-like phosphodiesterase 3a n=1 Tax=Harmonia axyridis TaxID=115357 RepID=UPI001E279736|nr:acid sphingomyelinase-like phosphodiesterase 3a [Harmonia axyridis]
MDVHIVFLLMIMVADARDIYEKIGYFWHITDIHYDSLYHNGARKGCWKAEHEGGNSASRLQRGPAGRFGDYSCDASWDLIESAAQMMKSKHNDVNVEFILWTGDSLSHFTKHHQDTKKLETLQNLTDLLHKTFSSQFVFPALGHDDPSSRKKMGEMWSRWFPADSLKTFVQGGYYMFERKTEKLQIVVLNTNLMRKGENDVDAAKQWDWLLAVMRKLKKNGETAYLVGHMAPGCDERQRAIQGTHSQAFTDYYNKKYLSLVRQFSEIIVGQFFGHLHSDTFRVIYNERGHPASWAMLAPALTPRRTADGPNNPGLRLYKFNQNTGQILDYTQYYLDLTTANLDNQAKWSVEYNFSAHYMINNITPLALHNLAEKLSNASGDNPTFNRYYRANSVRFHSNQHSSCDATCAHAHYCGITRLDYQEHEHCLKTAASVVASYSLTSTPLNCFSLLSLFAIFKVR